MINPIIVRKSRVPNWFSSKKHSMYGITFFPFIFISDYEIEKTNEYDVQEVMNHEKIHFEQICETGIIGFYVLYFIEFLYKSIRYKSISEGYHNISFEKEAYRNMKKLDYLKSRKRYKWIKYIMEYENILE